MCKSNHDNPQIGQITNSSYNYGSLLQCFATQKIFKKNGYECELIEIYNNKISPTKIYNAFRYRFRKAKSYLTYKEYIHKFKELDAEYKSQGGSSLTKLSQERMMKFKDNYIRKAQIPLELLKKVGHSEEYIAFISGSDQIWGAGNYNIHDNCFLRFTTKDKRIAFAPSFGIDFIPIYNQNKFKKYISEYNLLSCREKSGCQNIKELTEREADLVCDPVFQLHGEYWEGYADKSELSIKEKYIFAFFIDEPSQLAKETIKMMQKRLGYNVKMIAYKYEISNMSYDFIDGDPIDFLYLIKNAELVITDSFHATAFSLIFHTNFYTVERNYVHSFKQSVRITDLLYDCGYSNKYINTKKQLTDNLINKVDFVSSDIKINKMKMEADIYMKKIKELLISR